MGSELKVILNDIVDGLQSGQITFSNGLSAGKLGGELSDSQTTLTFPDATDNMMQIGTITDGNNGGVLFELANQFDNSDFHSALLQCFSILTFSKDSYRLMQEECLHRL